MLGGPERKRCTSLPYSPKSVYVACLSPSEVSCGLTCSALTGRYKDTVKFQTEDTRRICFEQWFRWFVGIVCQCLIWKFSDGVRSPDLELKLYFRPTSHGTVIRLVKLDLDQITFWYGMKCHEISSPFISVVSICIQEILAMHFSSDIGQTYSISRTSRLCLIIKPQWRLIEYARRGKFTVLPRAIISIANCVATSDPKFV